MANWCVVTRLPPDVYNSLSQLELREFYKVAKKIHGLK